MTLRFPGIKEERHPASPLPLEKMQSGIFMGMSFVAVVVSSLSHF